MWIYGAFAGFFSRENHITWQVMETFSDDPNVARLQLGYNTKYCGDARVCFTKPVNKYTGLPGNEGRHNAV